VHGALRTQSNAITKVVRCDSNGFTVQALVIPNYGNAKKAKEED
jgi:hypothetical protein